jgi:hypothetical protein
MKRAIGLTVALAVLTTAGSALAFQTKHCGVVSYSWVRQGHHHAGKDAVFVLRGTTSCTTARRIDSRADEGLRTPGWRCALSQHRTVTTCTGAAHRAEIQGIEYNPPPVTPTPVPSPTPTPVPTPPPSGCYPTTATGTCYEPGEYCPVADYGTSGVAGDGEAITCQNNNGWRWEPTATSTTPTPTPIPIPAGCYPTTASGSCYEPGEYCPAADYGTSGVAGDGEAITCENNNGWRWEPT